MIAPTRAKVNNLLALAGLGGKKRNGSSA